MKCEKCDLRDRILKILRSEYQEQLTLWLTSTKE